MPNCDVRNRKSSCKERPGPANQRYKDPGPLFGDVRSTDMEKNKEPKGRIQINN